MSQELPPQLLNAYQNAGKLKPNKTEIKRLMAPFPDKVIEIRPETGAIYIPHIYLSRRLNEVFGPGEWALICHGHQGEEDATTVRAEYSLVIRGCLIGSSMGEWALATMGKYADALEATAGEALRRICGKRLSCGDQVWMPDFIAKWTEKNAELFHVEQSGASAWRKKGAKGRFDAASEQTLPERGQPAADENLRHVMLQCLSTQGNDNVLKFAIAKNILTKEQKLDEWPLNQVAIGEKQIRKLQLEIQEFFAPKAGTGEGWRNYVVNFGAFKGQKLGDLGKENVAAYWEFVQTPGTKMAGKNKEFKEAVLEAGKHYGFQMPKAGRK